MKKLSGIALAIAGIGISGLAIGDGSGETSLSGSVPENCGIIVFTGTLDVSDVLSGLDGYIDLDMYCNRQAGATFSVTSQSGGFQAVGVDETVVYNIDVSGIVVAATGNSQSGISQLIQGSLDFIGSAPAEAILYTDGETVSYAGQYTDVLTFAISAGT